MVVLREALCIEENEFDTFDAPILYAKSVDGLIFRNNTIRLNTEYKPFHWNKSRFLLERVTKCTDRVNNVPIGQCANMPIGECINQIMY